MQIETKFNLKDHVFFMENNKIKTGIVLRIEFIAHVDSANVLNYIIYVDKENKSLREEFLFLSKEELFNSL